VVPSPFGITRVVAPAGGLNATICAGSGPSVFLYGGKISLIQLGNQLGGLLTTCTFVSSSKPKITGAGKALAVASFVETSLGQIPINAAY